MLTKPFNRREKVLLIVLALLLLFSAYYFAVHRPVTEEMARIQTESENISIELTALEARQQRMDQMRAELQAIFEQPNTAQIPSYDNLEQVMAFLNALLSPASDYNLSFEGLKNSDGERIVRRVMNLTFTCDSYELARDMVLRMQDCPYRCQLSNLSVSPASQSGASSNARPPLTDGPVSVSLKVTFFESRTR